MSSTEDWACPHCTVENKARQRKCTCCGFGRTENVIDLLRQRELLSQTTKPASARKKQSTSSKQDAGSRSTKESAPSKKSPRASSKADAESPPPPSKSKGASAAANKAATSTSATKKRASSSKKSTMNESSESGPGSDSNTFSSGGDDDDEEEEEAKPATPPPQQATKRGTRKTLPTNASASIHGDNDVIPPSQPTKRGRKSAAVDSEQSDAESNENKTTISKPPSIVGKRGGFTRGKATTPSKSTMNDSGDEQEEETEVPVNKASSTSKTAVTDVDSITPAKTPIKRQRISTKPLPQNNTRKDDDNDDDDDDFDLFEDDTPTVNAKSKPTPTPAPKSPSPWHRKKAVADEVQLPQITIIKPQYHYPESSLSVTPHHHFRLINNPQLFPIFSRFTPTAIDSLLSQYSPLTTPLHFNFSTLLTQLSSTSPSPTPLSSPQSVFHHFDQSTLPQFDSIFKSLINHVKDHAQFLSQHAQSTPFDDAEKSIQEFITNYSQSRGTHLSTMIPSLYQYLPQVPGPAGSEDGENSITTFNHATGLINNINPRLIPQTLYPTQVLGFCGLYKAIESNSFEWSGTHSCGDIEDIDSADFEDPRSEFYQDLGENHWPPLPVHPDHPLSAPSLELPVEIQHDELLEGQFSPPAAINYTWRQWEVIAERFPPLSYDDAIIFRVQNTDPMYSLFSHLAPFLAAKNIHFVPHQFCSTFTSHLVTDESAEHPIRTRGFISNDVHHTHFLSNNSRYTEKTIFATASGVVFLPSWLLASLLYGRLLPQKFELTRDITVDPVPPPGDGNGDGDDEAPKQPQVCKGAKITYNFSLIPANASALRRTQHRHSTSLTSIATTKYAQPTTSITIASLPRAIHSPYYPLTNTIWFVADGPEASPWVHQPYPGMFYRDYIHRFLRASGAIVLDIGDFIEALLCGISPKTPSTEPSSLSHLVTPHNTSSTSMDDGNSAEGEGGGGEEEEEEEEEGKDRTTKHIVPKPFSYNWEYFSHKFNLSKTPFNAEIAPLETTINAALSESRDLPHSNPIEVQDLETDKNMLTEYTRYRQTDQLQFYPMFIISGNNFMTTLKTVVLPYAIQYKPSLQHNIQNYITSLPNSPQPTPITVPQTDEQLAVAILANASRFPWVSLSGAFDFCGKGRISASSASKFNPAIAPLLTARSLLEKEQYYDLIKNLQIE